MAGMIVAFSLSPMSSDPTGSVTDAVAAAVRVVRESGLPHETNAMFTNIEGEWDEVMAVVKQAVDVVAAASPRVGLVLKADIRPGYDGQLTAKVRADRGGAARCTVRPAPIRTGSDEVVLDLTRRRAPSSSPTRGDGLLHVFVPHATAGHRDHRDRRRSRRRPAGRPRRPAARRRPVAAPPRLPGPRSLARDARARAAVRHRPGARRPARARHLAEHLPGRPQRRQRRARGALSFLAG